MFSLSWENAGEQPRGVSLYDVELSKLSKFIAIDDPVKS